MVNLSTEDVIIQSGDRIAQMIISAHEKEKWIEVGTLAESERDEGGFGLRDQIII